MSNVNFETATIIKREIRHHIATTLDQKPLLQYSIDQLPLIFELKTLVIHGRIYQISPNEILVELDNLVERKLVARVEDENVIFLTQAGINYARSRK